MWTKVSNSIDTLPDGKLLPVKVKNGDCTTKKEREHSGACSSTPRSSTFTSPFTDSDSCDQTRRPTIMQHQHQHQHQHEDQHQNQHPVDDDAPWDEALAFSPISLSTCTSDRPKLTVKIPSSTSTEGTPAIQSNNPILSNLPIDHNDDCSLLQVHSPEPDATITATPMAVTVKSKSRPKKRSKKLETGNDVEPNYPEHVSISSESGDDKDSLPREARPNPSNNKPRNTLDNSSSHEKFSIKTPTNSTKKSARESLKDDTKPLSFIMKDSKPLGEEDVSSVASSTMATRKSRIDTKQQVERITHSQEEPQVVTNSKPKTKGNATRSTTTKGVVNETRSILSSNSASLVDQIPDLACSDISESKDFLIDNRSLGSLNSSTMMESLTSLESQNNGSDLRTKADSVSGRKGRRRNKQRSEGSIFFPSALQASSTTLSARCNDSNDRSKSGTSQDGSTPKNRLTASSSTTTHLDSDFESTVNSETFEHSTLDLQDLMPPLKPKSFKGNQQETKSNNAVNASEILKKKIMQMNESLRLKAFHGDSCSSLQSESSLDLSLSSKSDHGITTRRPRRTLSGNEGKFRQSCPPENNNNNNTPSDIVIGDPPSTRRRRKSVDGSSTRQREKVDTTTVKEARRRLKVKGKDEESGRSNKVKSKSPRRNHGRDTANVSSRSLSKSDANMTSTSWQETPTISMAELDVPTMTITPQAPPKQGKNKSSSSKKSNAKDGNKATHTSRSESSNDSVNSGPCPEIATDDDEKDATTTLGKSNSPKSHRKDKDAKPSSQSQLLRGKDRSYSFTSTDKIERIKKKEEIIRSRSQSPSRKGKRQPKSLLNPETLDAWQISQQQKHRVTPFPSVYCRRLDDDDDDDDDGLNPALLLPPAFRQLQVAQKPKSSRF